MSGSTAAGPVHGLGETAARPLVFVVNDERSILNIVAGCVTTLDWRVMTFLHGPEALEALQHHRPDLIISDVTNRPMRGPELWSTLRERGVRTPFVFLSANASDMKALFNDASDRPIAYIDLPFSMKQLTAQLRNLKLSAV